MQIKATINYHFVSIIMALIFFFFNERISLVVQGRLHASSAGSAVLIPGQGTKIPHATWYSQWSFKKIKNGKWQMLARIWRTLITVNVNGAATVKNSLAIYIKGKHRVIIWPSISTPKCIPQRTENIFIQKFKHDCSNNSNVHQLMNG